MKGGNAQWIIFWQLMIGNLELAWECCLLKKLQPAVQTVLNEEGKIEFHISIAADQEVFEELNERYKIMIS